LDKRILIPLPGKEGRKKLFELYIKKEKVGDDIDLDKLINMTDGYSCDDISNVCKEAAMNPIKK